MSDNGKLARLLMFNLAVDEDNPSLGFATGWIRSIASRVDHLDVVTMRTGRFDCPSNVRVFSVGKEQGFSEPRRGVRFYRILTSLLRSNRYDACFAHMMPLFAVMGTPLLKARRIPIVLWYAHRATPWLLRLAERTATRVLTSAGDSFGLQSSKVIQIGQGIDTELFDIGAQSMDADCLQILAVGRITGIKRLELLVDAVELLTNSEGKKGISVRVVGPVGDSDYTRRLKKSIESKGLGEVFEFVGPLPRHALPAEYHRADVLVHPAPTGAPDKAALEAMACGTPVAAGNRTFVSILEEVPLGIPMPADTPGLIAEACLAIRGWSPEHREDVARRLREVVVRNHSLERLADIVVAACAASRS